MAEIFAGFFLIFNAVNLVVALFICSLSVLCLSRESRWIRGLESRIRERWSSFPPVSIIIPAYNEQDSIVESIKAALRTRYPRIEIVVVNDGSHDATLERVLSAFPVAPCDDTQTGRLVTEPVRGIWTSGDGVLIVIDKHNGGKSDAINAGLNFAKSPLVCVVDADTALSRDTLLLLAEPFLDNPGLLAAGGFIRLKPPESTGIFPRILHSLQELEYARSYGCFRAGLNLLHANVIISGALGLFRRSAVVDVGGYDPLAVGEDMELILRLHTASIERKRPYAIVQIGHAFCRTAACDSLRSLRQQRLRWQRGLLSSLNAYRGVFFQRGSRGVGFVALPYLFIFDVIGPFVEILGLLYVAVMTLLGELTPAWLSWLCLILLIGSANNLICLAIDGRYLPEQVSLAARLRMMVVGVLEPFAYHWLNLWWRLRGTLLYLTSVHTRTAWSMRGKQL